jgi:hypothetical protein
MGLKPLTSFTDEALSLQSRGQQEDEHLQGSAGSVLALTLLCL